jgi:hypothetical protein
VRHGEPAAAVEQTLELNSPAAALSAATSPGTIVPRLMKFSGALRDAAGKPLTGAVDVTFSLYNTEAGGEPLWFETQSVQADELGRYTALLGAMHADGLPVDLFTSGEVRWLGIQIGSETEQQPRVLLVSVPYALKAGDAETLGGKPASAYMLNDSQNASTFSATSASVKGTSPAAGSEKTQKARASNTAPLTAACSSITSSVGGTVNAIPMFTSTCNMENSIVTRSGNNIGIGLASPAYPLDITSPTNASVRISGAGTHQLTITGATSGRLGQDAAGFFFASDTNGGAVRFLTNNGSLHEWMRVTSAGNMGIGTTAPASPLDVQGNNSSQIISANQAGAGSGISGTSSAGNGVYGVSNGAGSGVLGVGNDVSSVGVTGQVTDPNGIAGVFSSAGGTILLGENGSTGVFSVDGSGRIGGSGAVLTGGFLAARLIVQGNAQNILAGDAGCSSGFAGFGFGNSALTGCTNYSMVGNGTDTMINRASGGKMYFRMANVNQMIIDTAGNVGVGTDSPSQKLEVNGGVQVDGTVSSTFVSASTTASNSSCIKGVGTNNSIGVEGDGDLWGVEGVGTSNGIGVIGYGAGTGAGGIFNSSGNSSSPIIVGKTWINGFGYANEFRVDYSGKAYANGGYASSGADFAESVAVRGKLSQYEPGDLMVLDSAGRRRLALAQTPYSSNVAGIYSTKPGMLASLHNMDDPQLHEELPLAVVGIVPCKVTAINGPIHVGDLLVSSSLPGYAMKGTNRSRMLGAVVGKAMEPLPKGKGVIQVLVTLQ